MDSVMSGSYGAPVASSPMFMGPQPNEASGINPLNNLIQSVNNPACVRDMKEHMDKQSDKVVKAVQLIAEIGHGGKGKAAQKAFKDLIDPENENVT